MFYIYWLKCSFLREFVYAVYQRIAYRTIYVVYFCCYICDIFCCYVQVCHLFVSK